MCKPSFLFERSRRTMLASLVYITSNGLDILQVLVRMQILSQHWLLLKCHRVIPWRISIYFSKLWRLGSPKSRCQQIWLLMRNLFLVCRGMLSYCVFTWLRGHILAFLSIRVLISLCKINKLTPPNPIFLCYHSSL
jgi:hypothetical protein